MFEPGYYVTAELKVLDLTRVEEMKVALAELQKETLKEQGCTIFCIHQDSEDEKRLVLWERFNDEAAFNHHFTLPHTKSYLEHAFTDVVSVIKTNVMFKI